MNEVERSVIDQAIAENRAGEYVLYLLSSIIVLVGCGTLVYGAVNGEGTVAVAGGLATWIIYPAFQSAREMRRQNIALRLLDEPLTRATTPEEAAEAIRTIYESFQKVFIEPRK